MKKYILLAGVVLSLFLYGCVEPIDVNPSGDRKVVVNCILTPDAVQKIRLNYTSPHGQNYYEEISNATITLFEADKAVGEFQKSAYAEWQLHYRPKPGFSYKLVVQIPDEKEIKAITVFPHKVPVRRLKDLDGNGKRHFEKDSAGVFWAFAFEKPEDVTMRPVIIDPKFKLHSKIGSNYPKIDNFNHHQIDEATGTNKKYFAYLRMLADETTSRFYLEELYSCVVVFRAVSDEYDQYLKTSIAKMLVYQSFEDPTQWLDESEIFSNIENGVGIFGAYTDVMFNCNLVMPD
ncbi:MAG: DUF4249 family protein [Paludibacteraceae bacterium]